MINAFKVAVLIPIICLIAASISAQEQKPELVAQTGHSGFVESIVFSPDGKLLAIAGGDKTLRLRDIATGIELRTFLANSSNIRSIAFSPDGRMLASGDEGGGVTVWDIKTGNRLNTLQTGWSAVQSVTFHPVAKILAAGYGDGKVRLWDLGSSKETAVLHRKPNEVWAVDSLAFTPDGKTLVSRDYGTAVAVWEVANRRLRKTFEALCFALSADGRTIAVGNYNSTAKTAAKNSIRFFEVASLKEAGALAGEQSQIHSLVFNADRKTLTTAHFDTISHWDITGQSKPTEFRIEGTIRAFSPDGSMLVATEDKGESNPISILDVKSGTKTTQFAGISNRIASFSLSFNGGTLAAANRDGKIKVFDVANGRDLMTLETGAPVDTIVAVSPDGSVVATGSGSGTLKLFDTAGGKELTAIKAHSGPIQSLAFSPDGKHVASGSTDRAVKVWDTLSGKEFRVLSGMDVNIYSIAFSPDGALLAAGSSTIKLWNLDTGKEQVTLEGHPYGVKSLNFSNDGKMLVSTFGVNIRMWETGSWKKLKEIERTSGQIVSAVLSPDGRKLASVDSSDTVNLWEVDTGKELGTLQKEDSNGLHRVAFSPDGKMVISATGETQIKFREAATGRELMNIVTLNDNDWLATTPDGRFDGTPAAWKQLIWRFDNDTFNFAPVEAFFAQFYYPGLLQDVSQGRPIPPLGIDLSQIDVRQPAVEFTEINDKPLDEKGQTKAADSKTIKIKVEITDNTKIGRKTGFPAFSDAKDVRLFRNGSLVRLWQSNAFSLTERDDCQQIAATRNTPRKAVCETEVQITAGRNELSAYAFNHQNVKSNDATVLVIGSDSLKRKGQLNILAIGINEYADSGRNLKFAVADAVDLGAELRKRQLSLSNYETSDVVQLTDAEATKANILYALERFANGDAAVKPVTLSPEIDVKLARIPKTQPEDAVIIYFAGHGTAHKDRFYLIPHDGFPTDVTNEQSRIDLLLKQSVSDLELEAAVRDLDAGKLLLIVDACNSGQALEAEEKRRGPMNSRGLAQLAYEKGMYILTAAQSYQAALEVSRTTSGRGINHGLLTYSLLEGLTAPTADIDADRRIVEREWLNFAVFQVPQLQVEAMRARETAIRKDSTKRDIGVFFIGEAVKNVSPEKRGLQVPRVFYRRELETNPFIVALPKN